MQIGKRTPPKVKAPVKKHDCPKCVYWMSGAKCLKKRANGDDCPHYFSYDAEKKPK